MEMGCLEYTANFGECVLHNKRASRLFSPSLQRGGLIAAAAIGPWAGGAM